MLEVFLAGETEVILLVPLTEAKSVAKVATMMGVGVAVEAVVGVPSAGKTVGPGI
jgi:hypothetical protein